MTRAIPLMTCLAILGAMPAPAMLCDMRVGALAAAADSVSTQPGKVWSSRQLRVTAAGDGTGVIFVSPSGTMCRADCVAEFAPGDEVVISALAEIDSAFAGWRGDEDCLDGRVSMDADRACVGTFLTVGAAATPGAVDLNGDGAADAFTYDATAGTWSFELGDRAGRFGAVHGTWSPGWQVFPAEFNGDRLTDFFLYYPAEPPAESDARAWFPQAGQWVRAINAGAGEFVFASGVWSGGWSVHVLDLTGDGRSDVFLYDRRTGAWFTCVTAHALEDFVYAAGRWSPGWEVQAVDWNGDRVADLFLYNDRTGQWARVTNNRAAGFSYDMGLWSPGWTIVAGDFNGDWRSDLLLYNRASGEWTEAFSAEGGFAYRSGAWPRDLAIGVADFDANLRNDLFLSEASTGRWFQAVTNVAGEFDYYAGTWTPGWRVTPTDFDRDGRSDLLLYNPSSGQWVQAVTTGLGVFGYTSGFWNRDLAIIGRR